MLKRKIDLDQILENFGVKMLDMKIATHNLKNDDEVITGLSISFSRSYMDNLLDKIELKYGYDALEEMRYYIVGKIEPISYTRGIYRVKIPSFAIFGLTDHSTGITYAIATRINDEGFMEPDANLSPQVEEQITRGDLINGYCIRLDEVEASYFTELTKVAS